MAIMNRRPARGKRQATTLACASNHPQPAALDAAALHLYGPASGRRVSGAGLAELQLLNLGGGRDR